MKKSVITLLLFLLGLGQTMAQSLKGYSMLEGGLSFQKIDLNASSSYFASDGIIYYGSEKRTLSEVSMGYGYFLNDKLQLVAGMERSRLKKLPNPRISFGSDIEEISKTISIQVGVKGFFPITEGFYFAPGVFAGRTIITEEISSTNNLNNVSERRTVTDKGEDYFIALAPGFYYQMSKRWWLSLNIMQLELNYRDKSFERNVRESNISPERYEKSFSIELDPSDFRFGLAYVFGVKKQINE